MTILIILGLVAVAFGTGYYLIKSGKVEDKNGNLIPDSVEEKIEDAKKIVNEVKTRAKRVAQETKDVVNAAKEVVKQSKDVIDAVKGTPRKGRKPAAKKTTHKTPVAPKTVVVQKKNRGPRK